MTQWHLKSKRKKSGGKRKTLERSDKRLAWLGGNPSHTTIGETAKKEVSKKMGYTKKAKLKADKIVNATDQKTKKVKKLDIIAVEENNADRQFARRNIITKGAILKVKDGSGETYVKVTNRPGQEGNIKGIILEHFEKAKQKAQKEAKEAKQSKRTAKKPAKKKKAEKTEKEQEK